MTIHRTRAGMTHLFRVACAHAADNQSDGQLLRQFVDRHDGAAFAALVRRHGPMVLGVCRRILGNAADAEDAFQATFLVLVRRAAALGRRAVLGDWLHGVARRAALNARRTAARHRAKEQAMARPEVQAEVRDDWLPLLDEALGRLPEKYRLPVVLCDLEGRTRREAAQRLRCPEGTVAGRLARGRALLARRLTRQGLTLSGGALAVLLARQAASARVPAALAAATAGAARRLAAGGAAAAAGAIPPRVAALTEGVMKAMFLRKLHITLAGVLVTALLAVGYAVTAAPGHHHPAHPGDPVKQEEHSALFDLVRDGRATHVAVADGAWGDPGTWDKKSVPGAGARAVIPEKHTVTVTGVHDKERLDWLRVDGTLRFDPKADTALKVVTLVGNVKSTLEIGTEKERVRADRTARLILGDRGVRDDAMRRRDPYDLSGGLLSHGRVRMFGAQCSSHATPTAVPKKGDTEVHFATAPGGWKVGDRLLFPGLDRQLIHPDAGVDPWTGRKTPPSRHQDEVCTVQAVSADGRTVTLGQALAYAHGGIYGYPGAVPVGNLSRNVVVESENVGERSRRGHVMFMHTQDVILDGALFRELGRTDAGTGHTLLTDPEVKNGKLVPGTDANTRGRYACHFHLRWGATYRQQPFVVRNCAIDGSPKLGVVNHGGYGLVDDNVAYRVKGSAFFTEVGNEIGRFRGNLAVRSIGDQAGTGDGGGGEDSKPSAPGKPTNFGAGGHGFWLQGGGVDVTDNFAIGCAFSAFFFSTSSETPVGKIQEPGYPATKGTPWEH